MNFVFFRIDPGENLGCPCFFWVILYHWREKTYWMTDWFSFISSVVADWSPDISLIISTGFLLLSWRAMLEECIGKKMFCNTFSKVCLLCKIVFNSSVLLSKHNVWEGIYMQHIVLEKQKVKQYFYVFRKFLLRDGSWLLLLWHISCWLGPLHFIFQLYW